MELPAGLNKAEERGDLADIPETGATSLGQPPWSHVVLRRGGGGGTAAASSSPGRLCTSPLSRRSTLGGTHEPQANRGSGSPSCSGCTPTASIFSPRATSAGKYRAVRPNARRLFPPVPNASLRISATTRRPEYHVLAKGSSPQSRERFSSLRHLVSSPCSPGSSTA